MKKTIAAALFAAVSCSAFAQGPEQPQSAAVTAAAVNANVNQAMLLEQVIGLRHDVQAAARASSACSYEGKDYSEGAIRQVGKVSLVCVERNWGVHISSPGQPESRELVWEPLDSDRIAGYRNITHLSSK